MRLAGPCRYAIVLAVLELLLSTPPGRPQTRPRTFVTTASALAAVTRDFPACATEAEEFPAPSRLMVRCNLPGAAGSAWEDPVRLHLLAMGARGLAIEEARAHVLAILAAENSCSAWFRESDPEPAAAFRSLDFTLSDGPKEVVLLKSAAGDRLFKHPYSAGVPENAGHNATVQVNANGPFFARAADVVELDNPGSFGHFAGRRALRVGSYQGNSLPARVTTLLHELGHVTGRLPDDSDELSGLSDQNTERVLQACHAEIKASTHQQIDKKN
jgi:hypothetical protein